MRSGYNLLQENLGMFLGRVFERHIIPLLLETLKTEELVSIVGSPKELKEIDENVINHAVNGIIVDHYIKTGTFPDPQYIDHLRKIYKSNLQKFQNTRYFKVDAKALSQWKYEVEVFVTGESFNKAVVGQQLNEMLMSYARLPGVNIDPDAVFKEILDLMGLGGARFLKSEEDVRMANQANQLETPQPANVRPMQETEMVGEANTLERRGK